MQEDHVVRMERALALLKGQRSALKKVLSQERRRLDARSEEIRAAAAKRIAEIAPTVVDLDAQIETKGLEVTFEYATRSLQDAYHALQEGQRRQLEAATDRALTDRVIATRIQELESIRATFRLLAKRDDELTELIRQFVQARPRGWMHSDDPLKRYLAWFAESGSLFVFLKDNPRYTVTVQQLIDLLGKERAEAFLRVSHATLAKAIADGLVQDAKGNAVTLERLRDLRRRTVAAPSVEIRRRGEEQPIEELLDLLDLQYVEGDGDDISTLNLDGATEKALRAADVHRVGQLRRSGDELTHISGIGEKRADAIHTALTKRKAA